MPSLVITQQIVNPILSKLNVVALMISINEEVTCSNSNMFEIYVTISSSKKDNISSRMAPFENNVFVAFDSIVPGEYNCTTSVRIGTETVDSNMVPCSPQTSK